MLIKLIAAVLDTLPAPSGHIYAALATHGCTAEQYAQILSALSETGLIMLEGQLIEITPKGEGYKLLVSEG